MSKEVEKEKPTKKMPSIKILSILFAVLVVVGLASGAAVYFYMQYQKAQTLLKNPASALENEVKVLVAQVNKVIELPKNEVPTVATVSDKSKLANQPFFLKAENGDKVLIYNTAKKAYLYRPKENKMIEVSSLSVSPNTLGASDTASSQSASEKIAEKAKVILLNGTSKTGLTKIAEDRMVANNIPVQVVDRDNAVSSDFKETILVDVSKKNNDLLSQIEKTIGGKIGTLPEGQTVSQGVEILVILGENFK